MTNKLSIYCLLVGLLVLPIQYIYADNGLFNDEGYLLPQRNRTAINEDFKPDYSCLFDVFQEKCIPGSEQQCPKPYFSNNEDYACFPKTLINGTYPYNHNATYYWKCPAGYHTVDEDETGQCYSNKDGCIDDYILEKANKSNILDSDTCVEP